MDADWMTSFIEALPANCPSRVATTSSGLLMSQVNPHLISEGLDETKTKLLLQKTGERGCEAVQRSVESGLAGRIESGKASLILRTRRYLFEPCRIGSNQQARISRIEHPVYVVSQAQFDRFGASQKRGRARKDVPVLFTS